jgi:hypothetical protein
MCGLVYPPVASRMALSGRRRVLLLVAEKRVWARHFCKTSEGTAPPPTHHMAVRENGGRVEGGCEACVTAPNMRWLTSGEWLCRREAMKRSRTGS